MANGKVHMEQIKLKVDIEYLDDRNSVPGLPDISFSRLKDKQLQKDKSLLRDLKKVGISVSTGPLPDGYSFWKLPKNSMSSATTDSAGKDKRTLKRPLNPEATLQQFKSLLSLYEQQEVLSWPEIYFAGSPSIDKIGTSKRKSGADCHEMCNVVGTNADRDGSIFNSGYDDSRGDLYLTRHDHLAYRYEILSLLGKGSFGQVVKCYDHKMKANIALKVIRNKKRFEKQGIVEVNVLTKVTAEDGDYTHNLVHMIDHFYFRGHLCFAFELLGTNLYEWLKAGGFRGVHLGVIRRFATQILQCLSLLDRLKIIHCDLKPENILFRDQRLSRPLNSDSNNYNASKTSFSQIPSDFNPDLPIYEIKVIDFGSSCYEDERLYTYVQSRFYRSPEVILGLPYTCGIDMWSFGCVLAELYTGYPLFPGENEAEQLSCIMEIRGLPPSSLLARDSRGTPRCVTNSKGKKRRVGSKTLSSVLNCTDMAFLDFLELCLCWDPRHRLTPMEAMQHPFITNTRFIPRFVGNNHANSLMSQSEATLLRKSKYLSRNNVESSMVGSSQKTLSSQFSYEHFKNRLPDVSSNKILSKLGTRFSKAISMSKNRAHKTFESQPQSLPPISQPMLGGVESSSKLSKVNCHVDLETNLEVNSHFLNPYNKMQAENEKISNLDSEMKLFEKAIAADLKTDAQETQTTEEEMAEMEVERNMLDMKKKMNRMEFKLKKLQSKRQLVGASKVGMKAKKVKSKQMVQCFHDDE